MTRTAIIAALPGELKPLVRDWPHSTRNGIHFWVQRNEEEEWMAACAGAGQAAATRAFAAIEDGGPIDLVFSVGWAGALTPELIPGIAHNVAGVIDSRTGERFHCDAGAGDRWLVTCPIVADEREKQRLATAYPAGLVDMEGAGIARLALMRGIPFYSIKATDSQTNCPISIVFFRPTGNFKWLVSFFSRFSGPGTGPLWRGWARIAERLLKASLGACSIFWMNEVI
jgi:adenosylhomocysteine nucleosidase